MLNISIDLKNDKDSTLKSLEKELKLPEYFNYNLDSLYDCLLDINYYVVINIKNNNDNNDIIILLKDVANINKKIILNIIN